MSARIGMNRSEGGLFEIVHAPILRFFPDLVSDLGAEPAPLLRRAGIDPDHFQEGAPGATYRQVANLLEDAAERLRCPDFGMRLGSAQGSCDMFGPLAAVMKNSATFRDALEYVAGHSYVHSLAARIWLKRLRNDRGMFVGHDIVVDGLPNRAQTIEQILLAGNLAARRLTGGRARARLVHFRHQPVSSVATYRRYFGCEVRFGRNQDGSFFSREDLEAQVIASDLGAYERAVAYIDTQFTRHRPPIHVQARSVVMRLLGTGICTNERVAGALNLHPRTLHRRLVAEGTSFQRIKDEVRRDLLLYLLQHTGLDLSRISDRLGFSEQSVTTRCAHRWFGASPTEVRARRL